MGNNASSPKASGPDGGQENQHQTQHHEGSASSSNSGPSSRPVHYHQQLQQQQQQQLQQHTSPQHSLPKTAVRNPALVQSTRVTPAPPEPSITHAQGSNSTASSAGRPSSSMTPRSYSSAAEAAEAAVANAGGHPSSPSSSRTAAPPAVAPAKPTDIKPRALDIRSTPPRPSPPSGAYYPNFRSQVTSEALAQAVSVGGGGGVDGAAGGAVHQHHHKPPSSTAGGTTTDSEPPLSPYADSMDVGILAHNSMQDVSYLTRPPRLPLPIEEEVHTPGSPIMAGRKVSGDAVDGIEALDPDGMTPRSSTLSSGTTDEDDMEELRVDKTRPTVPYRLEWNGGGDKVYVTGTIFQWSRKQRLHRVEGRPGVFATTINILPGTHHIRFLVDGQIETSRSLPTTVDFGNNLVNYIEVAAPNTPPKPDTSPSSPASPADSIAPADKAEGSSGQRQPSAEDHERAARRQLRQKQKAKEKKERERIAQEAAAAAAAAAAEAERVSESPLTAQQSLELTNKLPKWKDLPDPSAFSHDLPPYLVDYDQPDESPTFHQAAAATEVLTQPPSLPGFLGKPILNAATLIKDDNSVLNMPNYTILNHLATSSIKNNILAVSATTRYKDKFVTIIVYKPTGGDDKN